MILLFLAINSDNEKVVVILDFLCTSSSNLLKLSNINSSHLTVGVSVVVAIVIIYYVVGLGITMQTTTTSTHTFVAPVDVYNAEWCVQETTPIQEINQRINVLSTCKFCPHCKIACMQDTQLLENHTKSVTYGKNGGGNRSYPNCNMYDQLVVVASEDVRKFVNKFRSNKRIAKLKALVKKRNKNVKKKKVKKKNKTRGK